MIFNVASLLTGHEGAFKQAVLEDDEVFTDRHHFFGINGPVRLMRTDRTVLVTALLTATVEDTCGRCLRPAILSIETEFEEEFQPTNRDLVSERSAPVEAEYDPALVVDSRNMLDMTDALAQSLSVAVPLAPLCKKDCAGFCPDCFVDLNADTCGCDRTPIDPRWQALAQLSARKPNSRD
jgi:uncharacterized protein